MFSKNAAEHPDWVICSVFIMSYRKVCGFDKTGLISYQWIVSADSRSFQSCRLSSLLSGFFISRSVFTESGMMNKDNRSECICRRM